MSEIRVAIIGVGNVASTFVQGIHFYNDKKDNGLWHNVIGGYKAPDIKIVSAFDINPDKIGIDISEAIFKDGERRYVDVNYMDIEVSNGILSDNIPSHLKDVITVKNDNNDKVLKIMKESKPDIVINLISSGMDNSSKKYAECSLESNASFVNTTSTQLMKTEFAQKFTDAGLLFVGDDLMSQFGSTAFHKGIIDLMVQRGMKVKKSYQLDVGGSLETLNTTDENIKAKKRAIKTSTINTEVPYEFDSVVGTTEYTDFLNDSRISYYWIYGEGFLNSPTIIDVTLRSNDGAHACNVLFDVVRAIKYCKDNNKLSLNNTICAYGFKNPPNTSKIRDSYTNFVNTFVI
ncbi:MAG: hypothetical protein EX285_03325 [Thaumarchaeota archaeon]|nr:hypothetical protein [Nitrososphaerota archaeon]